MIDETLDTELAAYKWILLYHRRCSVTVFSQAKSDDSSKAVCLLSNQHTGPVDDL